MINKSLIVKLNILILIVFLFFLQIINHDAVIILSIIIIGFDTKYYLGLKNYFLVYTFLLFYVAGIGNFLPNSSDIFYDMLIYILSFFFGRFIYDTLIINNKKISIKKYSNLFIKNKKKIFSISDKEVSEKKIKNLEYILIFLCIIKLALLVNNILQLGISNFYSGQMLAENIQNYGQESFADGLSAVVLGIQSSISVSVIVLYICFCIKANKYRINYLLLSILLIVMPLISLERGSVAVGVMFLLFVYNFNNQKIAVIRIIAGILIFLIAGIGIGSIRDNYLNQNKSQESSTSSDIPMNIIYGELSPIVAYSEIKSVVEDFGYQYGSTIILPFISKPLPRNWFPDKPLNTSGFYMTAYRPNEFAAGFSLAPSIFGDIYLNFGYLGCIIFSFVLGILFDKFDSSLLNSELTNLPAYLVFYYHIYNFLRNNLSDSLFMILISLGMFLIIRKIINEQ
jgi:oligosaccharide repeat unit polymerase